MSPNSVPFVFVNADCHPNYSMILRHFIDDNSLIWLFLKDGDCDSRKEIERWIEMINDSSVDSVVQLLVLDTRNPSSCSCSDNDDDENERIDGKDEEDISVFDVYKNTLLESLIDKYKNKNITILPDILNVCVHENFNLFKDQLEYIAIDERLFKSDPCMLDLQENMDIIEKICKYSPCIYIKKEELISRIKQVMAVTTEYIHSCLRSLHKQGKIIWLYRNEKLYKRIYPFVHVFIKSIRCLLRPCYNDVLNFLTNHLLKAEGLINVSQCETISQNFRSFGEISYPLYKILTFQLGKHEEIKDFLIDADLAWAVTISEFLEERIFERPYLVLPQFNKGDFDKDYFLEEVFLKKDNVNIDCALSITNSSLGNCCDLFVNLRCSINSWACRRFDWENIVYLYHSDGDISLFREDSGGSQSVIMIIVRLWSQDRCDPLPCEGNFRKWITDWYQIESRTRNNFSYKIVDVDPKEMEEYLHE